MEGTIGFLGAGFAFAGAMTYLSHLRGRLERSDALRFGGALVIVGLVLVGAAYFVNANERAGPQADEPPPKAPAVLPPAQTDAPQPTATTKPTRKELKQDVLAAYARYWRVVALAMRDLDASHLDEVSAGQALQRMQAGIEKLKRENTPVRLRIRHRTRLLHIGQGFAENLGPGLSALVQDDQVDRSRWLNPRTMRPWGQANDERTRVTYTLKLLDGVWKVVFSVECGNCYGT